MTPEQIVAETLDAGWEGVPVGPDSKISFTRWNVREFTRQMLVHHVRHGGNIGVRAGKLKSGVTVIALDRDNRREDTWRFYQRHGLTRSNCQVETVSLNWHAWFRLDTEIDDLKTKIKLLVNGKRLPVDVKASGYVVFPPSGIGTGRYAFREGKGLKRPEDLEPLPASVVELIQQERKEVRQKLETVTVCELPEDRKIDSARRALSRRFSIAGKNGDMELFKAACLLIQFYRLSYPIALRLLMEWNASPVNVSPPWPEARLRYKLTEAERLRK